MIDEEKDLIKFYGMEISNKDFPWKLSLILYTNNCSLACYGCHNRKLLWWWDYNWIYKRTNIISIDTKLQESLNYNYIDIELESGLYDAVILCGGEITMKPLKSIKDTIEYIKSKNKNILIRLDTNCIFPEKMIELVDYVDGFWCDIKFPYHQYKKNTNFDMLLSEIIWLPLTVIDKLEITKKMLKWLEIASQKKYTIYRTVQYPLDIIIKNIDDINISDCNEYITNYFDSIKNFVENNLKKVYYINSYSNI